MDLGVWTIIGAVAGVLALIGIVIGVITYRRQFPKRELQYEVETFQLLREYSHPASGLKVLLDGRAIADPHVVRIKVSSRSRADIPTASFDSGAPIEFESSKPIVITGWTAKSDSSIGLEMNTADRLITGFRVPAQLIRRKASGAVAGIAEGKPSVIVTSKSLIDIDVNRVSKADASKRQFMVLRGLLGGLMIVSVSGLIGSIINLFANP